MKNKRVIIWSVITLLTIIAVLDVFHLHPHFIVGKHDIYWSGFIHPLGSGSVALDGRPTLKIYQLGPVAIITYL
jgi:hypothetical protein